MMRLSRVNGLTRRCRIVYRVSMSRWAPDARERLEDAALELFTAQGYENTTVAQIAERAGLNRATFFRHFTDKREILFGREDELADSVLRGDPLPHRRTPMRPPVS